MAIKWTSVRNERLLLLIVKNVKVDSTELAKAWNEQYGDDDFQPTARAIVEQFGVLKKKASKSSNAGGTVVTNGSSTPKTPRTPKTPATTKASATKKANTTATTPSKRKKSAKDSSDEASDNGDDDDSELDIKNLPKAISRASLARTKKVPKRYDETSSESEFGSDGEGAKGGMGGVKREIKGAGTAAAGSANGVDKVVHGFGGEGDEIHVFSPTNVSSAATGTTTGTGNPTTNPKSKGSQGGGLDSIMRDLMADTGPSPAKKTKVMRKMAEEDDESDVSDFAAEL